MIYDTSTNPWQCRCQAGSYTQAGDTCVTNADVSTYLPANAIQDAIRMDYYDVKVGNLIHYRMEMSLKQVIQLPILQQ